jgi:hypothetical protein
MLRSFGKPGLLAAIACVLSVIAAGAQSDPLVETGQATVEGKQISYRIRSLPVSSFPDLPGPVADALTARGCVIPQTYAARRPENVVHASLEKAGSSDWAVLCSARGEVSLLVFFASASSLEPTVLLKVAAKERVQSHAGSAEFGFDWGIDPASPRRIHEAQSAMSHRPLPPDHDCLADSIIDQKTVYHLYRDGQWSKIDTE